ncbi:hypothetical protein ACFPAF_16140 [Hymenobacter endophyticus]|uniref:DUF2264 domain-containing protein n=1 Tax=Hymenobacter endophyticus TaxID=3076335 RepID=A0ABU3TKN3_9BACT|nr:hypothetical protein [Hymenobacter endophyticus]MDU0371932.1 hypothetical protein [Hymenobacter endophyticus]
MRAVVRFLLAGGLVVLAYLNWQLLYTPQLEAVQGFPVNQEVVAQLQFLQGRMHDGAGEHMQAFYPEGFVYLNALYALTWTELLPHLAAGSALHKQARRETEWALREIQSPTAQSIFEPELPLPYGAFYQGWSAYCLGRYLHALPPAQRDTAAVQRFRQQCALIATALNNSSSPFPESYRGAAWPADGVMCAAALAWHDRLEPPQYPAVIQQWLGAVSSRLDAHQLVPHEVEAGSGAVRTPARGSSQSQLLNFLIEIDSAYARPHFQRYHALFLTNRLGLPGIRESAQGTAVTEDIDSGPVIWGVGGAASLVGRRTMQRFGDTTTALGLRNSIEAFGLPWHNDNGKSYLLGQLPIADAFIAWGNAVAPQQQLRAAAGWRTSFQLLSGAVALCIVGLWRLTNRKKQHSPDA